MSSRLPVDELGELFGLKLDDEDVETVGGLMAKQLNKVPIAGSVVKYDGLELVAERSTGRRNRIGTVVATQIADRTRPSDDRADRSGRRSTPADSSPSSRPAPRDDRTRSPRPSARAVPNRADRPRGRQDHHAWPEPSRARTEAAQGACVRDTDGRTYAATSVALPHLQLSAVAVAVAMAVSSGAQGLEAVALAGDEPSTAERSGRRRATCRGTGVVVWSRRSAGRRASVIEVDVRDAPT